MLRPWLFLLLAIGATSCDPGMFSACSVETVFDLSKHVLSVLSGANNQAEFDRLVADMNGKEDGFTTDKFSSYLLQLADGGEDAVLVAHSGDESDVGLTRLLGAYDAAKPGPQWVPQVTADGPTIYAYVSPLTDPSGREYLVGADFRADRHSADDTCSFIYFTECTLPKVSSMVERARARLDVASDNEEDWAAVIDQVQTAKERGDLDFYADTALYTFVFKLLEDDIAAVAHAENPELGRIGWLGTSSPYPLPIQEFIEKTKSGGSWLNYTWYDNSEMHNSEVHKITFIRPVTSPDGSLHYVGAGFQSDGCTPKQGCAQNLSFCSCSDRRRRLLFGNMFPVQDSGSCYCTH